MKSKTFKNLPKKWVITLVYEFQKSTKKSFKLSHVCYEKIWYWESICLLQKNLEIDSYVFATKKFGNRLLYVCYEKNWNLVPIYLLRKTWKLTPICLLWKNLEFGSYMFAIKKFTTVFLYGERVAGARLGLSLR